MAADNEQHWAGALGMLHLAGARFAVVVIERAFPVMSGWAFLTHGVALFVLSFIAPPALQVKMWKRWALLATVSAGTLIEQFARHPETRTASLSGALLLVSALMSAAMALDGWRMERMERMERPSTETQEELA